eukprot:NODE_10428_length_240_cov_10.994764_g9687_i0.p3 GENE.NODE_10428_length_240_cov_10.994764_g9687_i0~~NODE_10428_length_240_cov_10.994764_g9687_i0.p3  ORF type:complete len:58 (+),score=5.95 NODE_10428_length_240_cov_10.994764_g9687_i0:21-194(+)
MPHLSRFGRPPGRSTSSPQPAQCLPAADVKHEIQDLPLFPERTPLRVSQGTPASSKA